MTIGSETHRIGKKCMRTSTTQEVPADLFVRPNKVGIGNTHCLWTHHLLLECQETNSPYTQDHRPPEASAAFQRVDPFCELEMMVVKKLRSRRCNVVLFVKGQNGTQGSICEIMWAC